MIKYTVYVDDDRIEFVTERRLKESEVLEMARVILKDETIEDENIVMIDFEDAE